MISISFAGNVWFVWCCTCNLKFSMSLTESEERATHYVRILTLLPIQCGHLFLQIPFCPFLDICARVWRWRIFEYIRIFAQFSISISIQTFVWVKFLIWIYLDIRSCKFFDMNIFVPCQNFHECHTLICAIFLQHFIKFFGIFWNVGEHIMSGPWLCSQSTADISFSRSQPSNLTIRLTGGWLSNWNWWFSLSPFLRYL